MNDISNQSLQPTTLRASLVSSKPSVGRVEQNGKTLPQETKPQGDVVQTSPREVSSNSAERQREKLNAAVANMNEYTQSTQRDIQFNVDDTSGHTVVSVIDRESQDVIRQIPDEAFLKMARAVQDSLAAGNPEPFHLISARA